MILKVISTEIHNFKTISECSDGTTVCKHTTLKVHTLENGDKAVEESYEEFYEK